jgi:hypothetical protein
LWQQGTLFKEAKTLNLVDKAEVVRSDAFLWEITAFGS